MVPLIATGAATPGRDAEPGTLRTKVGLALGMRLALGLAVAFTLVVGILPDRVVDWADRAVPVLTTVHR